MADAPIPSYEDLSFVYGEDAAEAKTRYEAIKDAFVEKFGSEPDMYARSPGRVNLIGEHVDYEGYGVLPMAIKQDTIVALRKGGDSLVISNLESAKYQDITFTVDPKQLVDTDQHVWANYFLAAYKGVFEYLESKGETVPDLVGIQVMVHGLVPTGSGLSSSAALTCSTSMAILGLYGITLTKGEVADFTCKCERYVGTESGGMDQAISVMGLPGMALKVDFNPIRVQEVTLPQGATFVVANSLTVSNKAETGPQNYNMRVVECRLAADVLAVALGTPTETARGILTLKDVEPIIAEKLTGPKGEVSNANVAAAHEYLHEEPYSQSEVEDILGVKLDALLDGNHSQLRVLSVAAERGGFKLRQRAEHVYGECLRPGQFAEVCASSDGSAEKLQKLGVLMDDSQASCRDLYECSCAELDTLVSIEKKAGAIGARLTGAGWGGCTVSLVPDNKVAAFITTVKQQYYAPLVAEGRVKEEALDECIFATKPACGGGIIKMKL